MSGAVRASPHTWSTQGQRWLYKLLGKYAWPIGSRAESLAKVGHWKYGLYHQDTLSVSNPVSEEALRRLPLRELELRDRRLKLATVYKTGHRDVPKEYHTRPDDDIEYLTPYILEVLEEKHDRITWRL